ncbi:MAG: S8 family serine peptidase [Thermoanaerobaculia bacterium]
MKFVRTLVLLAALPLFAGDRYIVEFDSAAPMAQARSRHHVRREFSRVLHGVALELRDGESIESLRALPNVIRITKDTQVAAHGDVAVSSSSTPRTNAGSGAGVIVAVIDSGIDYTHPALGSGIGAGKKIIGGYDFVNDDADPMDDYRHGTHVAGIIAAKSGTLNGVAPETSLLAYKVLDANGKGFSSDIIAAIERAVADGADVINMSLGGPGNPNDPLARAVENAVAQGVVVCVSAGNEGIFHTIGSPASAPSAITVGAVDANGAIAEFSSRGPATTSGAIKPDVLAPGVSIVSTIPGGGTMSLSGTSMAAPYVSALAALLREQHPAWTPARVKAALVATALSIDGEEVMTQGSGRVDRTRAFANALVVSTTQLNLEFNAKIDGAFDAMRRVSIRNESNAPKPVHVSVANADAITFNVSPAEFTLGAGEARDVDVAIHVDNAALSAPSTDSLAFGGALLVQSDETLRVPWSFLRAARASITYERGLPNAMWRRITDGYESFALLGPNGVEILLKPGRYDFAIVGDDQKGDVRLFFVEDRMLDGDVELAFTAADAPHEIRFDAELPQSDDALYSVRTRLVFPDASGSVVLPEIAGRSMHASSFSNRYGVLANEAYADASSIYIAQHPLIAGLQSNVTLHLDRVAFAAQPLEVRMPADAALHDIVLMPRDWPRRELEFGPAPPSLRVPVTGNVWQGTLYMTPEVHADFAGGLQVSTIEAEEDIGFRGTITPMIRRDDRGFFAAHGFLKSELPMYAEQGESLVFGDGVLRPPAFEVFNGTLIGETVYRRDRDETRRATKLDARFVVKSGATEIASGALTHFSPMAVRLTPQNRYRFELRTHDREASLLTMEFGSGDGAVVLPAFTWLSMQDAMQRHDAMLPLDGNGSLVFAAKNVSSARTAVFVRRHGFATWVQLTPVEVASDATFGTIYRVDLQDALRLRGELDLSIEIGDSDGNVATWLVERAFSASTKRRATR